MTPSEKPIAKPPVRGLTKKALFKILTGGVAIYLLWPLGIIGWLQRFDDPAHDQFQIGLWIAKHLLLTLMALPFVFCAMGVIELVSRKSFREISDAWLKLEERRRKRLLLMLIWVLLGVIAFVVLVL